MVDYFSCALENHQISGPKRCLSTKNVLNDRIKLLLISLGNVIIIAYKYICIFGTAVYHSADHPNLRVTGSP